METYELEKELESAFSSNAELMAVLPNGAKGIYHLIAPSTDPERYPIIVYAPISDVPNMAGDNREIMHSVTMRIHLIASQRRYAAEEEKFLKASKLVREIMASLNYVRRQTTPYVEDGKIMMIFDYVRSV